ncbi:hypothetical protein EDB19DRAFT_1828699 [Suillus lakei]|nr:hypothetical protein EDB19DRAFT_1828699 [Suillus lakei]
MTTVTPAYVEVPYVEQKAPESCVLHPLWITDNQAAMLHIQQEIVNEHKHIEKTTAGAELIKALILQMEATERQHALEKREKELEEVKAPYTKKEAESVTAKTKTWTMLSHFPPEITTPLNLTVGGHDFTAEIEQIEAILLLDDYIRAKCLAKLQAGSMSNLPTPSPASPSTHIVQLPHPTPKHPSIPPQSVWLKHLQAELESDSSSCNIPEPGSETQQAIALLEKLKDFTISHAFRSQRCSHNQLSAFSPYLIDMSLNGYLFLLHLSQLDLGLNLQSSNINSWST